MYNILLSLSQCARTSRRTQTHRAQTLLGATLAIVLIVSSVCLLGPPLAAWQSNDTALQAEVQFASIESSVQLLRVDTSRVVEQAKTFLKQHHRVQVASSARSRLVTRALEQRFADHARDRFTNHALALKDAIASQSTLSQRTNETREQLQALNLSLSTLTASKKTPRALPITKAQVLQLRQIQHQHKQLNASIVALVIDTAKEAVERSIAAQDAQTQRADARRILASLRQLEAEIDAHSQRQASKDSGAVFFYAFVMCLTGGYLWTAAAERRRRPLQHQASSRVWSPVPRFLLQIKHVLKSAVVRVCLWTMQR